MAATILLHAVVVIALLQYAPVRTGRTQGRPGEYWPTADGNNNISVGAPINARLTLSTVF